MADIDNMKFNELQKECARLGLGGQGTKADLQKRLDGFLKGDVSEKVFTAEDDNIDISPEEIEIKNPTVENKQILANNELDARKIAHEAKWESLSRKLDIIFAGRVQYFLQENCPNNYSVVFKGAARRSECINITAGEKTILQMAQKFVSPTKGIYITKGGDTPEEAMKKFQDANPNLG